jgi:hypothetical protein
MFNWNSLRKVRAMNSFGKSSAPLNSVLAFLGRESRHRTQPKETFEGWYDFIDGVQLGEEESTQNLG